MATASLIEKEVVVTPAGVLLDLSLTEANFLRVLLVRYVAGPGYYDTGYSSIQKALACAIPREHHVDLPTHVQNDIVIFDIPKGKTHVRNTAS